MEIFEHPLILEMHAINTTTWNRLGIPKPMTINELLRNYPKAFCIGESMRNTWWHSFNGSNRKIEKMSVNIIYIYITSHHTYCSCAMLAQCWHSVKGMNTPIYTSPMHIGFTKHMHKVDVCWSTSHHTQNNGAYPQALALFVFLPSWYFSGQLMDHVQLCSCIQAQWEKESSSYKRFPMILPSTYLSGMDPWLIHSTITKALCSNQVSHCVHLNENPNVHDHFLQTWFFV